MDRRIHDGRLVAPPLTSNCCQVSQSRTTPPVHHPLLPLFVSVSDLDSTSSLRQSPARGKGGRTDNRTRCRRPSKPWPSPPSSSSFSSPRPPFCALPRRRTASGSYLPRKGYAASPVAGGYLLPSPLPRIWHAGCFLVNRITGTAVLFISLFRDYENPDAFLLHHE